MISFLKKNLALILLALVVIVTRGNHVANAISLPDASWAIFLILGFYSARKSLFLSFIVLAALIDYVTIAKLGISDYCITPAYAFLVPAYFSMWLAGRLFAKQCQLNAMSLMNFAQFTVVGTLLCEIISSGSFYFLGGRFSEASLFGFGERLVEYFPHDLMSTSMYLGIVMLAHVAGIVFEHSAAVKSAR
jgi:hypothetical protein